MTTPELVSLAASKGIVLDPSLLRDYPLGTPFYCLHHNHGCPVEFLYQPLANRIEWVLKEKPEHELSIRFAAMRPVLSPLPEGLKETWAAYVKARDAYYKAEVAYAKAEVAHLPHLPHLPRLLELWSLDYPDHPRWTKENGLEFPNP